MIDFVLEYWCQIAVYLIGCVLAYARAIAQVEAFKKDSLYDALTLVVAVFWIIFSWLGFLMAACFYEKGDKFFKWAPIFLLCVLLAVGCKNEPLKYKCLGVDGTSHGSDIQYPKGTRINWGSGDPAWMVDSCYEFAIKENALK